MIRTGRVKLCGAFWTHGIAVKIFSDRELMTAIAAQNGFAVSFTDRPRVRSMGRDRRVAFVTGKPFAAAFKFYSDDVNFRPVMTAARLPVNIDAIYLFAVNYTHNEIYFGFTLDQFKCVQRPSLIELLYEKFRNSNTCGGVFLVCRGGV